MTTREAMVEISHAHESHDATEARAVVLEALHKNFSEDPEWVWDLLFEALNDMRPDPLRAVAERLLRTGVTEDTLLSEIWPIIISDVIAQQ